MDIARSRALSEIGFRSNGHFSAFAAPYLRNVESSSCCCAGPYPGGYGGCNPPKFVISKIFWVNLWQLYYIDSTVFKFCTSMCCSALAPAFYKGLWPTRRHYIFSVKLIWQQWTISIAFSSEVVLYCFSLCYRSFGFLYSD